MNRLTRGMATLSIFTMLSACACLPSATKQRPTDGPSVADVVKAVQVALDASYKAPGENDELPALKSVKVALQTVQDNKASVEADYLLVALKGYNDKSVTQELDVTLTPKPPALVHTLEYDQVKTISDMLQKAIAAAQKQVQRAYEGKFPLYTSEVDVQIGFVVTYDASAGINKWSISPISLTASDEVSKKIAHTITIVFAKSG